MQSPSLPTVSSVPANLSSLEETREETTLARASSPAVPRNRYVVFFSLAIVGCAIDLLTKHWVFRALGMPGQTEVYWLIEGYFGFQTATNPGALFGMGGAAQLSWLFALLSVVAALAIPYWLFYHGAASDLVLTIALGSVMGGVFGNLYDRLGLWSAPGAEGARICEVRDWILCCYGSYTWPNFNIADCLLVCGAALLMWRAFFTTTPEREAPPSKV
ncbi:signal peptidase II [Lignipirellula cremea]|uniref:Lipoprotein signal peptidase n=1 Tax=Lignipirellula cremea TaxID=2528010 RepID=A0A518E3H5_9BACT|nr:signal peptidase II [Lignipirellula cremea]QDU98637.1 lipoprotein signal peptidase [Lignipirellula cremea]